jgi:membrane protein DedA with SNARE-associated domain
MFHEHIDGVLAFVREHHEFAAPMVFLLAFGESLAFVSLMIPATVLLIGVGALIGASGIDFWPIYFAAAIGAGLGDWLSYWLGLHYHVQIARMWPLSRHPELLPRGHVFFEKWGWPGVFIGRFFGPLRAVVPLVAGACEMPRTPFQLANWSSAFVWAGVILGPGAFGLTQLKDYFPF